MIIMSKTFLQSLSVIPYVNFLLRVGTSISATPSIRAIFGNDGHGNMCLN